MIELERGARDVSGYRQSRHIMLDNADIEHLKSEIDAIQADKDAFRFNEGHRTGFSDRKSVVNVKGDVFPDKNSKHPRDLMSERAVLAHEYYGHRMNAGTRFEPDDWHDEYRASYMAAHNSPGLSMQDRQDLLNDAAERAKMAGVGDAEVSDFLRRGLRG
ncbi:MAG: hypothetical protein FWF82_06745 [Oscillospiraceae bacterium]|nr:hypothetical protein [Oscillospiraceae bacterium]